MATACVRSAHLNVAADPRTSPTPLKRIPPPLGSRINSSNSPPVASTQPRKVEMCVSVCFSSFDTEGCFMYQSGSVFRLRLAGGESQFPQAV